MDGCPHHERIAAAIEDFRKHQNGNHVQLYQIDRLREDVVALTDSVKDVCVLATNLSEKVKLDDARRDSRTKVAVAWVGGLIALISVLATAGVQLAIAHMGTVQAVTSTAAR